MSEHYDKRTALVVVDVQNDFAAPDGSLYVAGGEDLVPQVNDEIAAARTAGAFVVYTQDWHPPSTPHFAKDGGVWPVHCVQETPGAAFHPDLTVDGPVVRKGVEGGDGYSGFSVRDPVTGEQAATNLETLLREQQIERVVVVGLALDYCVKETALDAQGLGFDTTLLTARTRAVNLDEGDDQRALHSLAAAGVRLEPA